MFDEKFIERFEAKYTRKSKDECWDWSASLCGKGYGQIKLPQQRKQEYAHRIAFTLANGQVTIPAGKYVCHSCDNPKCVNPNHLWLGDSKENHADMVQKDRHLYGERNDSAVLGTKDVLTIKQMLKDGVSQERVGRAMGVSQSTVWKISKGLRWAHLSLD